MAGSIPLQPSSMAVVAGDAGAQALRALANAQAVAVAMKACCLKAAVGMVVYWASVAGQAGKVRAVEMRIGHDALYLGTQGAHDGQESMPPC
jgi:enamine deaminase RidA (YjgF/YER057c/UK114 family)